jgi:hypothetical protein
VLTDDRGNDLIMLPMSRNHFSIFLVSEDCIMDRRQTVAVVVCLTALSMFLSVVDTTIADEPKSAALVQTLPQDGVWVTFNVNGKFDGQERLPTWTLRSVGQAFHGGKQCRFIEMEQASEQPQLPNMTWRFLVPEDEFGEGKDPISKAVKCWVKIGAEEPELVESLQLKDGVFAMSLAGPKRNLKHEEAKKKINWQQGDLECAVISGHNEVELGIAKFSMSHRVMRHKDVPFGLAGMQQDLNISFGDQKKSATIKIILRDHGKDAKAKLPDLVP